MWSNRHHKNGDIRNSTTNIKDHNFFHSLPHMVFHIGTAQMPFRIITAGVTILKTISLREMHALLLKNLVHYNELCIMLCFNISVNKLIISMFWKCSVPFSNLHHNNIGFMRIVIRIAKSVDLLSKSYNLS